MTVGNRIFKIGDTIDPKLKINWSRINPKKRRLYFKDENGFEYSKRY